MPAEIENGLSQLPVYLEPIPVNRAIHGRRFRRKSTDVFYIGDPASGSYISVLVLKAIPEEWLIAISIRDVRNQQKESENSYQLTPNQTHKLRGVPYYIRGDIKVAQDRKVVEFAIETPHNIPVFKAEKYRAKRKKLGMAPQAEPSVG